MSCFFDSNVLVYAMDRAAGARHALAMSLIEQHLSAGSLVISTQVLQETYAVLTRKLGVAPAAARAGLAALARERVVGADAASVLRAMELSATHRLSIWDALIVGAALDGGCRTLFSEDLQAGRRFRALEVVDPFTPAARERVPVYAAKTRSRGAARTGVRG